MTPQELLFCFRCAKRHKHTAGRCDRCGGEGGIMGWSCARCARVVRGQAPEGPLVCGECPEPLATPEEVLQWTDESGAALDGRVAECRDCGAWVRKTNRLPPGQSRCMPCAVGRKVRCAHPAHRGDREILAHQAQLGVYSHRTKAGRTFLRRDTLCLGCYVASGAVAPSELSSQPSLAGLPELPYALETSPRERYPADAAIFDRPGIRGEGERRVIRIPRDGIVSGEFRGRFVQWIACEEYRATPSGEVSLRLSVSFNSRLLRAVKRQVAAKRAAFNPHATAESLGWILAECVGIDGENRQTYRISYPVIGVGQTPAMWAAKVLITG